MSHKHIIATLWLASALLLPAHAFGQAASGKVTTSAPTYGDGNFEPLSLDATGSLRVTGGGGGAATIANGADATQGAIADAAATQGSTGTISAKLRTITSQLNSIATSQYPAGAIPITASTTGTTGATSATLAANASRTTHICGFSIRANATAAATANSTVSGTVTGTLNFTQWTAPLASGIGVTEQRFNPCIPGSAINTTVSATSAAAGAGGVVSVAAWGYQL